MRVAIYARVSDKDKQDPEMQEREMREFCERRGWRDPAPVYFEDRISSRKLRPELERMKKLCRRRKFDLVLVYRFDRFARSSLELHTALEEFGTLGVNFVSLHEHIDTTTPQGKLMFAIFAAFAEFERELIHERVMSGLEQAKAKGIRLGRRPRCGAEDVEKIKALRGLGHSWRHIAFVMGLPTTVVRRAALILPKPVTEIVQ